MLEAIVLDSPRMPKRRSGVVSAHADQDPARSVSISWKRGAAVYRSNEPRSGHEHLG
jgi:hypothetical protein